MTGGAGHQGSELTFQIFGLDRNRLRPQQLSSRERRGAELYNGRNYTIRNQVEHLRMDLEGIGPCMIGFTQFSVLLCEDIPFHNPQTINNNYYNNNYNNYSFNDEIPVAFIAPIDYNSHFYLPITDTVSVLDFNNSSRMSLLQEYQYFRDQIMNMERSRMFGPAGPAGPTGPRRRRSLSRSLTPPPARIPEIQIQIAPPPPAVLTRPTSVLPKVSERVALALARDGIAQKELCPIGQSPLVPGRLAVTSCHCVFQAESLEPWAETKTSCPTCRSPLDFRIVIV